MSQAKFIGRLHPQNSACLFFPLSWCSSFLNRPVLTMRDRYYKISKVYVIFSLEVMLPASLPLQRLVNELPNLFHSPEYLVFNFEQ